jgi:hypothetical protein
LIFFNFGSAGVSVGLAHPVQIVIHRYLHPCKPMITKFLKILSITTIVSLSRIGTFTAFCQENLQIINGNFPRAFFFRDMETMVGRVDFPEFDKNCNRLMGIEGKAYPEAGTTINSANAISFYTSFKNAHPNQLVLLHFLGSSRSPDFQINAFSPGHWVHYVGTTASTNIPLQPTDTDIPVGDVSMFSTSVGLGMLKDDITLCAMVSGKPDWTQCEQVKLISIDATKKIIRVQRGQYNTLPRAFSAGAYVAPMILEVSGADNGVRLWYYNFASNCPKDSNGQNCSDILAKDLGDRFAVGHDLASFDGIEFDVLQRFAPEINRSPRKGVDVDGDGVLDNGIFNQTNSFAAGTVAFFKSLRIAMGNRLILSDGWSASNQRAFGIVNGVESEGWPNLFDLNVNDWSGGLNRMRFWKFKSATSRKLNYALLKFNQDGTILSSVAASTARLVFAGSVFTGSAITCSIEPDPIGTSRIGIWDELVRGVDNKVGWLGKPKGPAVHLAEKMPNFLTGQKVTSLPFLIPKNETSSNDQGDIKIIDNKSDNTKLTFQLVIPTQGADQVIHSDIYVKMIARAAPYANQPVEEGRKFTVSVNGSTETPSMCWLKDSNFTLNYAFRNITTPTVTLNFEIDSSEAMWIHDVEVYGSQDITYREFEHGLVVANPSYAPFTFNNNNSLSTLFPGIQFWRIKGSSNQDPETNNGALVSNPLILQSKDALFLSKAPPGN